MKMQIVSVLVLLLAVPSLGAQTAKQKKKAAAAEAAKPKPVDGRGIAKRLRGEWDLGELKMMRVVLEDAQYSPDLKASCGEAIDTFAKQQEDLLSQVEADGNFEDTARKRRAKYEAAFNQKMQALYANPEFKADMARRLKALDKEIDAIAMSAEKLMATLDSVGVTPEQKAKIAPVAREANRKVRAEVDKSETRSARDKKNKDKVVASYREIRKKLRQELTPEQREKLTKKLAEEA